MLAVAGEGEDGVDVVSVIRDGCFAFALFLLLGDFSRGGGAAGAEDGVGVEGINEVEVPDFDVGIHGAYGNVVAAGVGSIGEVLADGDVEPFDAEGNGGEHDVVVNIEVVGAVFVDVDLEVADVVFGFGGDEKVVGGEDLELFALFVIFGLERVLVGTLELGGIGIGGYCN